MKRVFSVAALVLAAGSLSACGGGPGADAPTDASVDDFCAGFIETFEVISSGDDEIDAKDAADALAEAGTPEDISDEEREGFEIFVEALDGIGNGASQEDVEDADEFPEDEAEKGEAFINYATTTCQDQLAESVTG